MKQKDILTLVVIGIVSAALSVVLSNMFLTSDSNRSEQVEVVESISPSFERPPREYYNDASVNPTQVISIQQDPDSNPFREN